MFEHFDADDNVECSAFDLVRILQHPNPIRQAFPLKAKPGKPRSDTRQVKVGHFVSTPSEGNRIGTNSITVHEYVLRKTAPLNAPYYTLPHSPTITSTVICRQIKDVTRRLLVESDNIALGQRITWVPG
jgi:hypothetical protein